MNFDETQIQQLFGHEAAEDEEIGRLKQYYFKSSVYDQVTTDLPLRILVAHKGVGKSALFQIAMAEDIDSNRIAISIRPDDVVGLEVNDQDFLKTIRNWKEGLNKIISSKVLKSLGKIEGDEWVDKLKKTGYNVVEFLKSSVKEDKFINFKPSENLLVENFLKTSKIIIYIDDLDRGWQGKKDDVNRISALLNAVRDISRENKGVNFRVSLRSDVYYLVRTSDESTDKIEGSVIWHGWSNHEILVLLIKRIETFHGRKIDEKVLLRKSQSEISHFLNPIMETHFKGLGHWENAPMYRVLMSLVRKRPRDLVKLCTLAARDAKCFNNSKIMTSSLENIFEQYSQGRLQDTVNEFRSELPDIERLLVNMKPNKKEKTAKEGYVYNTADLLHKIKNIEEMGIFRFANGQIAQTKELAAFLYKINFLTGRKELPGKIERKFFEENRYLSNAFSDFGYDWEVHPAYRWALQPDDVNSIYKTLQLSE